MTSLYIIIIFLLRVQECLSVLDKEKEDETSDSSDDSDDDEVDGGNDVEGISDDHIG